MDLETIPKYRGHGVTPKLVPRIVIQKKEPKKIFCLCGCNLPIEITDYKEPAKSQELFAGGLYGFAYPIEMAAPVRPEIEKEEGFEATRTRRYLKYFKPVDVWNEIETCPGAIRTVEEYLKVNPKPDEPE